jgi:hypothetical protein
MASHLSHLEKSHSPRMFCSSFFPCRLNLISTFFMCVLTVSSMIPNRDPICRLVYPKHVSAVICCSRLESLSQFTDNQPSFSILLKPVETNSATRSSASRLSMPARSKTASWRSVLSSKERFPFARSKPNLLSKFLNAHIISGDYIEHLFLCQSPVPNTV